MQAPAEVRRELDQSLCHWRLGVVYNQYGRLVTRWQPKRALFHSLYRLAGDADRASVGILRRFVANHIGETIWARSQMYFAVFVADGGETGLRALDSSTFDLMIVDIFMPHMRGFESVRVFHQRAPMVPLIAISGCVFVEQRTPAPDFSRMALDPGAARCLRKPFTPKTLLTVIDQCLSESGALKFKVVGTSARRECGKIRPGAVLTRPEVASRAKSVISNYIIISTVYEPMIPF